MSFNTHEQSEFDGRPVELYWFMRGADSWCYSSGADEYELESQTFTPVAGLTRSTIRAGRERARNQLTVDLPRDIAVADEFKGVPRIEPMWLNIYRLHEGETDFRITWQGRVRFVSFKDNNATITLDDISGSLKKSSLRHLYQNQCNHFTYDQNCGLVEGDYTTLDVNVIAVDGNNVTVVSPEINGFYKAGQVRRANGDRRFVVSDNEVSGTHTLNLLTPFENLTPGENVDLIGGACGHTFTTCQAVKDIGGGTTDNSANYGGYPKVPRKNPFRSFQ